MWFVQVVLTDAQAAASGVDSGIAGLLVTVQSIIVVYHLAGLQAWLQSIVALEAEAEALLATTPRGDLSRARLAHRAKFVLRGYPTIQVPKGSLICVS